MAALLKVERVKYVCSCGEWSSLCRLYFCRHCGVLRCRDCVTHEVDSIFCSNCLDNMPTSEARVKKNRCANCFECPSCTNTLAYRATSLLPPGAQAQVLSPQAEKAPAVPGPKKVYYLACNQCRWTSRDAGIPDQSQTSSWPEPQNSDEKLLTAVLDQFRQMAAVEKADRERKKFTKRRMHLGGTFTDKYGLQALMTRRRLGMGLADKDQPSIEEICVEPTDEVPELPDTIFNEPLVVDSVTTVNQRLRQPLNQPVESKDLLPLKKPLSVRRSLRCKQCDHNLCKGEYSPSSIKFKIQLFAIYHVPEVRLLKEPVLEVNKKCEVQLSLTNLTPVLMHIVLLPNIEMEEDTPDVAKANIPVVELSVPMRDEAAELDDSLEPTNQYNDDTNVVIFRKKHKIGIKLTVEPPQDTTNDIFLTFILKYDYVNTVVAGSGDAREPEIVWHQQKVKLNLGKIKSE